ncbi:MAG TPA: tripartite tricarboxylate transporter substrate binding protein [Burkholderiales bacterium]|nr:tripartite tricarboxylate transporter substrate binding protein [Burkholderiales bacterium]
MKIAVSRLIVGTLAALAWAFAATHAAAQAYPAKNITIILPYTAGGSSDVLARATAKLLGEAWGRNIVVDNRPGASGMIGAEVVAKAPPDGYLLLSTTSSYPGTVAVRKTLPFDPAAAFIPVAMIARAPIVLAVHPSVPAKNVREFIALAKARPGELSFGSSGSGSSTHLTAELLKSVTGTRMTHIPYKGQGQAITDVVTGEIQFMFNSPSAVKAFIDARRLRVLGITSDKRSPQMPDVPTFAESGYRDLVTGSWYAVWLPAKTPEAIVSRLNSEIVRIVNLPDVRNRIVELGGVPIGGSSAEMDAFQKAESARWAKVVKESGAKAE